MHEEIYYGKRYDNPSILEMGEIGDYMWIIISLGTHPCAYVGVKANHPLFGIDYDEMYEKEIDISVHGGVTYTSSEVVGITLDRWWIGWDYAHSGDLCDYSKSISLNIYKDDKKWTLEEIKEDVKDVITQLEKEGSD